MCSNSVSQLSLYHVTSDLLIPEVCLIKAEYSNNHLSKNNFCMKTSPTNKVFFIFCSNASGFMKRIKEVESGNLEEVNKWGYLFENVNV